MQSATRLTNGADWQDLPIPPPEINGQYVVTTTLAAPRGCFRLRGPRRMSYRLLTNVVFTDPQVATVGLTEKEANARQIPFLAASYPFNDHGKSIMMEALDGFVKLLANPKTDEILGGCCVGPVGGELIHEIVVGDGEPHDGA